MRDIKILKQFFKIKETYLGIIVAVVFQLVFFTIWLTAYDGVFERTEQLKVAIVNEDKEYGHEMKQEIIRKAPFDIKEVINLKQGKKEMDKKDWNMIIYIPATFTEELKSGQATNLIYYINQSNPTISKQMMENAAIKITRTINDQIYIGMQKQINAQLPTALAAKVPNPEVVAGMAQSIIDEIEQATVLEPVKMKLIKTNNVEGFAPTMIPLLVVLASFVGAMVMSQHIQLAADQLKNKFNKWSIFFVRQMINLSVSLILSLLTLALMSIFKVDIASNLFTTWAFQSLLFFSLVSFTQVFVTLFGNPGMIFNIVAMATQLVSSGTIVPREMLSSFYYRVGNILPATYGAEGYFSLIYGGGDIWKEMRSLLLISCVSILVACIWILIAKKISKKDRIIIK